MTSRRKIELLAPARDSSTAIEAIKHGADAVYMGAASHGARAAAKNSIDEIACVVDFAHQFDAKVYVTVNTIIYDNELEDVEQLVWQLYRIGVDALIVQDMALLRMNLPPIALHASTQCDIRTPQKAEFLQAVGFSQLVLARELGLKEIEQIHKKVKVSLECFVHGALCVSYSGRCQVSEALNRRSANRGECAQVCRQVFDLEDQEGNKLLKNRHLLSLCDMNRSRSIEDMIDAGISSFKIEGRLKDVSYVRNVVAYYNKVINQVISHRPDLYRASVGESSTRFEPNPIKSFNRGFIEYFLRNRQPGNGHKMASILTPKSKGEYIGRVMASRGKWLEISTESKLNNGDGLLFVKPDGSVVGTRVNSVSIGGVSLFQPIDLQRGAEVYRNFDKKFDDNLNSAPTTRTISVDMTLRALGNKLVLTINDERGLHLAHSLKLDDEPDRAKTNQSMRQREELSRLGDTIYMARKVEVIGNLFIPASKLTQLRRETIHLLDRAHAMAYKRDRRKTEELGAIYPETLLLSTENVANRLAERFYLEHGVEQIEPAVEVTHKTDNTVVMHTRYCLRRELGACLKTTSADKFPKKLFLVTNKRRLEVLCDCNNCEMKLKLCKA